MNYLQTPFQYAMPMDQPMGYGMPVSHHPYEQPMDQCYIPYHQNDIHGFYTTGAIEEYEEYVENLSRPRLTKEQVEILESQFQAHPKPNSNTKRQLALQTSLTLPRVANWFQNRRAKAKQQKRQEEFEKMQAKEKAMAAEEAESKQSAESSDEQQRSEQDQKSSMSTPTDTRGASSSCSEQEDHGLQTPADEEPEPKFEVVGHTTEAQVEIPSSEPAKMIPSSPIKDSQEMSGTMTTMHNNTAQPSFSRPETNGHFQQWASTGVPQIGVNVGSADAHTVSTAAPVMEIDSNGYWSPDSSGLVSQPYTELLCNNSSPEDLSCQVQPTTTAFTQSFMPSELPLYSSQSIVNQRHVSLPMEQGDISPSSGPNSDPESTHPEGRQPPRLHISTSDNAIGLAARRKRPRPAAIGTSGFGRTVGGPVSGSPTRRVSSAAWSGVRKSSQLAELSPRFGGMRKISGSPRSPFPYSLEGRAHALSNADLAVPPSTTSSIPPATPMTPDEMQYLLPPTPIDNQYCLSPQEEMGYSHSFPTSQSMTFDECQESKRQPPPFVMVGMPHPQSYQQFTEPMSAPPNFTTFNELIPGCGQQQQHHPLSSSEAETSLNVIHMPRPTHISLIAYDDQVQGEHVEESAPAEEWQGQGQPSSTHSTTGPNSPVSESSQAYNSAGKSNTEFYIQEFPQQDEAMKVAAQQLPPQRARTYTFTNQTPNDFYRTAIFPPV
ncbi:homeobox transcription factor [Trichophyton equinum CBS 127.97]|uniref:Homeobox transcription factor n=1 Tax=Trichophyton equinum (strain ATCC MYA-4606 / CBS 127.97) TaxID=559882 RepID=F2PS74_TRIEC|nr:homeobox transcription factor [Trichophyton equinum CBS 127.97]